MKFFVMKMVESTMTKGNAPCGVNKKKRGGNHYLDLNEEDRQKPCVTSATIKQSPSEEKKDAQ